MRNCCEFKSEVQRYENVNSHNVSARYPSVICVSSMVFGKKCRSRPLVSSAPACNPPDPNHGPWRFSAGPSALSHGWGLADSPPAAIREAILTMLRAAE